MAKGKKADEAIEESNLPEGTFQDGDDSLTINMDEVSGASYENVPQGEYQAVIEKCDFAMSKSSGKPMWNLQLTITDGEFAGRKLFTFVSFSEKALPMSKTTIQRIKPELLSSAFNPKRIAEDGDLLGTSVTAKVIIESYEGEPRSRVKNLTAPKGASGEFAS